MNEMSCFPALHLYNVNSNNINKNEGYDNCLVCRCIYHTDEMLTYYDGFICYECLYFLETRKKKNANRNKKSK